MNTLLRLFLAFVLFFSGNFIYAQDLDTKQTTLPCIDKTFSVVAHIVRDSFGNTNITEAAIEEAVAQSNLAFAPICMRFEICEYRIIENFQYDILDRENNEWPELQVKYHVAKRINMFFVSDIGEEESYVCGFASVGGIARLENGGIVLKKGDCIEPGSSTVTHELGHYFGLLHTFEGSGEELVNGSNCETTGDLICDTPADPFEVGDPVGQYVDSENCRFIANLQDANGEWYSPHVGNYMSYYPSSCACGFTYGQYLKMANTFLAAGEKMW